jgi:hypothetical protein
VPGAADERGGARHASLVAHAVHATHDLAAGAQRCAAVGAAVGQREESAVDTEHADAMAAEVDEQALALGGRVGEGEASLPQRRRRHG